MSDFAIYLDLFFMRIIPGIIALWTVLAIYSTWWHVHTIKESQVIQNKALQELLASMMRTDEYYRDDEEPKKTEV